MINRRKALSLLGLGSLLPVAFSSASDQNPIFENQATALDSWKNKNRTPVTHSKDLRTSQLIEAVGQSQLIAFYYFGGTSPRQLRLASIESVFRLPDSSQTYVSAYCHLRKEHRTFRVDRLSLA